jgi:hypothetical protein
VIRRLTSEHIHATPKAGTLKVSDRVITLSSIDGQLEGIQRLLVLPKAIVTPSVRDELKSNNIRLVRQDIDAVQTQTNRTLLIANLGTRDISQTTSGLPCESRTIQQGSLATTIAEMASQLTHNTRGAIICDLPEAAVCLANRRTHIKAFVGHSERVIQRAVTSMSANLLVLESKTNNFAMTNLLRTFLRTNS